ncbi:site-specific integrase [Caulobacter sp. RHG1]|uniref:tyrosine-type recombinase/integrase n=1 Tax=Caulobacter sp. (strain RHG1) TaxID=2545762 RepID=UPI0015573CB8|nr:site-specific integrase [Caulobacter sp. RHG1]NQE61926.1 Integrase [Caulobacter sp. RHG1]
MAFVIDKQELKPGLIIFRRSDVQHRNWYCRVKLPKADRYKTYSLKTADINVARDQAFDRDADVRFRLKHDVPVFNRPFRDVAQEYIAVQEERAKRHEISADRVKKLKSVIGGALEAYIGSTQVHLVGQESWDGYPTWRRENGEGRNARNGAREVSEELSKKLAVQEAAMRDKSMATRGLRTKPRQLRADAGEKRMVSFVSDSTIRFEMSIFGAVMGHAIKKRYAPMTQRFEERPKLKIMRRDEFTREEYRALHTFARDKWVKAATRETSRWYRTVAYNFVLIMCNTGMRPSEAKNLRWRDIMPATDKDGREIVVLFVQGKGKSRQLVAPKSVGDYLDRIREISAATGADDRVFTTIDGNPAKSLYQALIEDLLTEAKLRNGASGLPRSTYCFRHTYATFRLSEGVDVYFLAEQMGTSVKMIEDHYGHVNTIKYADRVLQGMSTWNPADDPNGGDAAAGAAKAAASRQRPRGKKH